MWFSGRFCYKLVNVVMSSSWHVIWQPIRGRGMGERRFNEKVQHKSWKVFEITSQSAALWLWNVFQFDIPKSLSRFHLPSFLQPCCMTLYCSRCIRLETWKMCFVWSNSKIMCNHHKANTTDTNLSLLLLKTHFMGENASTTQWESLFYGTLRACLWAQVEKTLTSSDTSFTMTC